jgi:hypothetical protein
MLFLVSESLLQQPLLYRTSDLHTGLSADTGSAADTGAPADTEVRS